MQTFHSVKPTSPAPRPPGAPAAQPACFLERPVCPDRGAVCGLDLVANVNEDGFSFLENVQIMVLWNRILCEDDVRTVFQKGNGNF